MLVKMCVLLALCITWGYVWGKYLCVWEDMYICMGTMCAYAYIAMCMWKIVYVSVCERKREVLCEWKLLI